jgi:hypothetical protein
MEYNIRYIFQFVLDNGLVSLADGFTQLLYQSRDLLNFQIWVLERSQWSKDFFP